MLAENSQAGSQLKVWKFGEGELRVLWQPPGISCPDLAGERGRASAPGCAPPPQQLVVQ